MNEPNTGSSFSAVYFFLSALLAFLAGGGVGSWSDSSSELPWSDAFSSFKSPIDSSSDPSDCSLSDEGLVTANLDAGFIGFYAFCSEYEYAGLIDSLQRQPSFRASRRAQPLSLPP